MSNDTKKKAEVIETVPHSIERDAFDEMAFEGVNHAKKIQELCKDKPSTGIVQDAFSALYKLEPKIKQDAPRVQKAVMKTMMGLPEYESLRAATQLDDISSALGSVQLGPVLIQQLKEIEEQIKKKQEQREKQREQDKKDGKQPQPQDGEPDPNESLDDMLGEDGAARVRQQLRKGMEEAQEEADQWGDMCAQFGVDPGEIEQCSFQEKFEIAETLTKSKKFQNIAELAGRFRNILNSAAATAPTHGYDEIVDIQLGDDIGRLVPAEILKLRRNKALFFKDMLEGNLQCYNLKGVENLGKGPVIVCCDKSPSMDGSRDEWATAVTLAMAGLCEKQRRGFGYIAFEAKVIGQKFWPKNNPPTIQDKIGIASVRTTGGTDFYKPLMEAFRLRSKDPELKPSDIIFITDGECYMSPEQTAEIVALKKQTDVRIYGIAINDGYGGAAGSTLQSFCDRISTVNSLGEMDTVKDLIHHTAKKVVKK